MADTQKHLDKAEKLLQKGKVGMALEEFLEVLAAEPGNDPLRVRVADLYTSLNDNSKAAEHLGIVFDRFSTAGSVTEAISVYRRLLRMGAATPARTFRYGQLLERTSRRDAMEVYKDLFGSLIAAGHKAQALEVQKRIVKLDPTPPNIQLEGELMAELGQEENAAANFFKLGQLQEAEGNLTPLWYERAYRLQLKNEIYALAYARAILAHGDLRAAVSLLQPFAADPETSTDLRELYAQTLLSERRVDESVPVVWNLCQQNLRFLPLGIRVVSALIAIGRSGDAAEEARRLEELAQQGSHLREFVSALRESVLKLKPGTDFLEYLADLYNRANREHDYCATLLQLFELRIAKGNFSAAAECLDRATDVDAYESGHERRLEKLRGKIDSARFNSIANRLKALGKVTPKEESEPTTELVKLPEDNEPTLLEDLMLQAEIFLQYSMRSKAIERLERIHKLFPREEDASDKLRQLYFAAGFTPYYNFTAPASSATQPVNSGSQTTSSANPGNTFHHPGVEDFTRVTEINRNISRQGTPKSVLFTTVNDVGRHWNVSRCVAGLGGPGKPLSAVVEYCAPGIKQSDVSNMARLISTLQSLATAKGGGLLAFADARTATDLEGIHKPLEALGVDSLMALPLIDGAEQVGIVILEQCGSRRVWRSVDEAVLKTISDQVILAVNNAKLRSLVKSLAVTDEKSGLLKRSSYLDVLVSEVRRSVVQKTALSVILLNFGSAKQLARELGTAEADRAVQEFGNLITSNLRQTDVAIRYDLMTIGIVAADTTGKNAFLIVEKLRRLLSNTTFPGHSDPVHICAGIAEVFCQPAYDAVDLVTEVINRLEEALALAKKDGDTATRELAPIFEDAVPA